jgi:response regulator RpfG family c-di-GMP phosphodiesterase
MNRKVLFVDDDPLVLNSFRRQLSGAFEVHTVLKGAAGLEKIRESGPFAVVVADMRMPIMDGVVFLRHVCRIAPDTTRVMLTGNIDQKTAADAVNEGRVFRFLTKPCDTETLVATIEQSIEQFRLVTAEAELLGKTLTGAVGVLGELLAITDPPTFNRARRIKQYAREAAVAARSDRAYELELAAVLMNLGYVTLPSDLVARYYEGAELDEADREILARVPEISSSLISKIPRLEGVATIVLYSHKQYDGAGKPDDGASAEKLPHGSRTLKILKDLVDLELSGATRSDALSLMASRAGWYDPAILERITQYFAARPGPAALSTAGLPATTRRLAPDALDALLAQSQNGVPSLSIPVSDIALGDIVLKDVTASDGCLLVPAGSAITQSVLHFIRNYALRKGVAEPIQVAVEAA